MAVPRYLWDDALARAQFEEITIVLQKTGSAAIAPVAQAAGPIICGMGANLDFGSAALCQSAINTLLGLPTTTETTEVDAATYFATTPMGTDSLGVVVSFSGQVRAVVALKAELLPAAAAAGTTVGVAPAALSATLATSGYVATAGGNVVARFPLVGLDAAATNSLVVVKMLVKMK